MVATAVNSGPKPSTTKAKSPKLVRVKVGGVIVTSQKASPEELRRGVQQSNTALQRLSATLAKPGVKLPRRRDVPLYSVDPEHPGLLIRQLNGKSERGVLENGVFKVKG